MDVTLSELLATFMESPLVVWVSGSSTRAGKHGCAATHGVAEPCLSLSFSSSASQFGYTCCYGRTTTQLRELVEEPTTLTSDVPQCSSLISRAPLIHLLTLLRQMRYSDRGYDFQNKSLRLTDVLKDVGLCLKCPRLDLIQTGKRGNSVFLLLHRSQYFSVLFFFIPLSPFAIQIIMFPS